MKKYLLTILFKTGDREEYMCDSYMNAFNLEKEKVNEYGEMVDISYIKEVIK